MRLVNFGAGEICDRLSILALKILHGGSDGKDTGHFEKERAVLLTKVSARQLGGSWFAYYTELAAVNAVIWRMSDEMRSLRKALQPGGASDGKGWGEAGLIALEQQTLNDRRADLIDLINKEVGDHAGSEKL